MHVVAPCAADQEVAEERQRHARLRSEQRTPDERDAVQLVDPMKRPPERGGREQHEPLDEIGPLEREVECYAAAKRVAQERRAPHAQLIDDGTDVAREIPE